MSLFKSAKSTVLVAFAVAATAPSAQAAPIAVFDLLGAAGTTLPVSFVEPGMTVSSMTAVGVTGAAFSNHFYFSGWGTVLDPTKYLAVTLSSASPYRLDDVTFSVESTATSSSSVFVRSSLDAFASTLSSFSWASAGALVTDATLGLGPIESPLELRFYFTAAAAGITVGFANHELGGAGGGLPDVGRDISINGAIVPEPASVLLLATGLAGLVAVRRRRRA